MTQHLLERFGLLLHLDAGALAGVVERLGWTLLHSLWQFAALAAALPAARYLLTRWLPLHHRSQARYLSSAAALAAMPCLAVVTFALTAPSVRIPQEEQAPSALSESVSPVAIDDVIELSQEAQSQRPASFAPRESTGEFDVDFPPAFENLPAPADVSATAIALSRPAFDFEGVRRLVEPWLGSIVVVWLLGVTLISLRPVLGIRAIRRLRRSGLTPIPPVVQDVVLRLTQRLGVRRTVAVVQSALVEVPAAIGWLKPMILLPVSLVTEMTPAQLEAIVAHELAHIRRHDYLVNLGQMLVETVFFYHPAVWWVSNTMRAEREDCCDDLVVRLLDDRATYVRALVAVDELRGSGAGCRSKADLPVPALSATGGALMNRARRIMGVPLERQTGWFLTPLVLGLCLACVVWLAVSTQGGSRNPDTGAGNEPGEPPVAHSSTDETPAADKLPIQLAQATLQSAESTLLFLVNAKDEPIGGRVSLAQIGYGPNVQKLPTWNADNRDGVSLKGVATGTQTLVVEADAPNATVFTAKLPSADGKPLRQRVLPMPAWYVRRNYETPDTDVSVVEQGGHGVIEVLLTNRSDDPFTFSTADFRLNSEDLRVILPPEMQQAGKTIKPHTTQKLRFDWAEIVRKGIWLSRNGEDFNGPGMPPSVDGKSYFRLTTGISRGLPVALKDPARVLADLARPQPASETRAALSGRIVYDGPRPLPKRVDFKAPDFEAWARDGNGDSPHRPSFAQIHFHRFYRDVVIHGESLVVGPENGLANVFVWLRKIDPAQKDLPASDPPSEKTVSLTIEKGRFEPHVLAMRSGQSLEIRSKDRAEITDVGIEARRNEQFHITLQPDASFTRSFQSEKVPFKLKSNLAAWMSAYVLPLDHPWFAVTGADGKFRIEKIPTGDWELVFWHEVAGWLPLDKIATGREKLTLAVGEKLLGELHVKAEAVALEKPAPVPAQPAAPQPRPEAKLPRELPLGNFGGIPQRATQPPPPPSIAPNDQGPGWIDAEYGLQYRLRMPDAKIVGTVVGEGRLTIAPYDLPLLYFDVRNAGDKAQGLQIDLGIESNQTQHALFVDEVEYTRGDQPWGGLDSLSAGGAAITMPFVLSDDWKRKPAPVPKGNRPDPSLVGLKLAEGSHRITLRLYFHEFAFEPGNDPEGTPRKTLRGRGGSPAIMTQPFILDVAQPKNADPPPAEQIAFENMRRELVAFPKFHAPRVSNNLRRLVVENQPASGNRLITLVADGDEKIAPDPASFIVAALWKDFSREQLERYLKAQMAHFVLQRNVYPAGVDAAIAVGPRYRSGYPGLPKDPSVESETVTTHFLDGQPVGEPFRYPQHTTISRWFRTGELSVGRHTIRLVTDYKFQEGEKTIAGRIESPEHAFEILPAETPDMLRLTPSTALEQRLRESLEIREITDPRPAPSGKTDASKPGRKLYSTWGLEGWAPQTRRTGKNGAGGLLHTPVWQLFDPLPVDLCFRTEFRVEGTDVVIPGWELVVFAGETRNAYFHLQNVDFDLLRKHADKDGFIPVRVKLIPSQAIALSHPRVEKYYGGEFVSEVVRLRVDYEPK